MGKSCSDVTKKHFNKELVITKEDTEDFESSTKCWICESAYIDDDVKVEDRRDCNTNVKLNHKILVVFHNLKNFDSYLIIQKLGKFNLKKKASYHMD